MHEKLYRVFPLYFSMCTKWNLSASVWWKFFNKFDDAVVSLIGNVDHLLFVVIVVATGNFLFPIFLDMEHFLYDFQWKIALGFLVFIYFLRCIDLLLNQWQESIVAKTTSPPA